MKLLLHTCCGPCFLGVWEDLGSKNFEVTSFYYNPNIQPDEEYDRRLANLRLATKGKTELIIEKEYQPKEYFEAVDGWDSARSIIPSVTRDSGLDSSAQPQNDRGVKVRCLKCYKFRLEKTAQYAKENGFDAFSTTLLVSPYQDHETLKNVGQEVGSLYGVDFFYSDWRPYFREGQKIAKDAGLYRQRYCGCKYSLGEEKQFKAHKR